MTEKLAPTKGEALVLRLGQFALLYAASGAIYGVGRLTVRVIDDAVGVLPEAALHGLLYIGVVGVYLVEIAVFVLILCKLIIGILRACMRIGTLIRGMRSSRGRNSSSS